MMFSERGKQLTIFINESERYEHQALYMAIIQMLKREGCGGATVVRGVACFGSSRVIHSMVFLIVPLDLPVVVTVVDRPDRIERALASLRELAPHSLITVREVEIFQSRTSVIPGGQ
jgi:hypothetical protein